MAAAAPYGFPYQPVPGTAMTGSGGAASRTDSKDNPHASTINGVIERVTHELKNILKRDFNKKMVEVTAFKRFENW